MFLGYINSRNIYFLQHPIPVPDDRQVGGDAKSNDKLRIARRVGIPQVERPGAKDADRIDPVAVPIACERFIARGAIHELKIGEARVVGTRNSAGSGDHRRAGSLLFNLQTHRST